MAGECSFTRSMSTELTGSFEMALSHEAFVEDKQIPDGTHYFLASLGDKLHVSFAQ